MKDLTLPTPAIKPCPFCGGEASARPRTCNRNTPYNPADRAFPIVRCGKCGAEAIGDDWKSEATAIEAWNRRAALSSNHEDGRAATDKESARDAALEQAANLVECEYAHDKTQAQRLAQIAQHIRDLKKRNQS